MEHFYDQIEVWLSRVYVTHIINLSNLTKNHHIIKHQAYEIVQFYLIKKKNSEWIEDLQSGFETKLFHELPGNDPELGYRNFTAFIHPILKHTPRRVPTWWNHLQNSSF